MSPQRHQLIRAVPIMLLVIVLASRVSPQWAALALALSMAVCAWLVYAQVPQKQLEEAMRRNDFDRLRELQNDPRSAVMARLTLTYARVEAPSELFECSCAQCSPLQEDGGLRAAIVGDLDQELHVHERLAQSFWGPTRLPSDWSTQEAPTWSVPLRKVAMLGRTLQELVEKPWLTTHQASLGLMAHDLEALPAPMRWPLGLAMVRYAAEVGLYEEARTRLATLPTWPKGSQLESLRDRYRTIVDQHGASGAETLGAERTFITAASAADMPTLERIANDPKHHAALASRLLLIQFGYGVETLPQLAFCACEFCHGSKAAETLTKHEAIANRLWGKTSIDSEVFAELETFGRHTTLRHGQMTHDTIAQFLTLAAIALHDPETDETKDNCIRAAGILSEAKPGDVLWAPSAVAAATQLARNGQTTEAQTLMREVPPFFPGSAIENHRAKLAKRLAQT